ncbi:MAG: hypothetical protein PHI97_00610 [Desulfobulbus sp.]|nr:hypothetical protein [Desulfobulbus sp.]
MEKMIMIHTKLARRVLNKNEQKHLTACGINSMATLVRTVNSQEKNQLEAVKKHGSDIPFLLCRCADCHEIARKLGILEQIQRDLEEPEKVEVGQV